METWPLVEFLTAVLDKREAAATAGSYCSGWQPEAERDESYHPHYPDPDWSWCDGCTASAASGQDADWTLRDVEAKRRIVELHCAYQPNECPDLTLRLLALPDADQPGFREEWRP
jgi:hypothetical protein